MTWGDPYSIMGLIRLLSQGRGGYPGRARGPWWWELEAPGAPARLPTAPAAPAGGLTLLQALQMAAQAAGALMPVSSPPAGYGASPAPAPPYGPPDFAAPPEPWGLPPLPLPVGLPEAPAPVTWGLPDLRFLGGGYYGPGEPPPTGYPGGIGGG